MAGGQAGLLSWRRHNTLTLKQLATLQLGLDEERGFPGGRLEYQIQRGCWGGPGRLPQGGQRVTCDRGAVSLARMAGCYSGSYIMILVVAWRSWAVSVANEIEAFRPCVGNNTRRRLLGLWPAPALCMLQGVPDDSGSKAPSPPAAVRWGPSGTAVRWGPSDGNCMPRWPRQHVRYTWCAHGAWLAYGRLRAAHGRASARVRLGFGALSC